MAETLKAAVELIEQGHVRVGVDVVRNPEMHVCCIFFLVCSVSVVEAGSSLLGNFSWPIVETSTLHPPYPQVTRDMLDHITWAEGSKIKRHVKTFRQEEDDYELLAN